VKRFLNNMKFKRKILFIVGALFFVTTAVGGVTYYHYAANDVEKNFTAGAEDVLAQLADTLDLRLNAVEMRVRGLILNTSFMRAMANYLNNPDEKNKVKALGEMAVFLKDLESGERLVHSSYIYTEKGDFENFTRMRNWDFNFQESKFYQAYQKKDATAVQWFPAEQDEIFKDGDEVIPYVRRFTMDGYYNGGYQYLIVQLKKSELDRVLSGKYGYFDKILIINENGDLLAGSDGVEIQNLIAQTQIFENSDNSEDKEFEQDEVNYLVFSDTLEATGWKILGLRSRESLLGSLKNLRFLIAEFTIVIFGMAFAILLIVSNRLTEALTRLEKRMSIVQGGDFEVRFFYPYHDEVGSLARSFNCMLDEIERLVKKQDETIQELKRERDFVAEVQKQKRKAELKALQAQINPHFLYNTLNAITWQAADKGEEEISILSSSLGRFFRISLSKGEEVISLREEIEHVTSYLEIQSIRYGEKLNYDVEADSSLMEYKVLKLILQPLAENSIYHGIKEKTQAGWIHIRAQLIHVDEGNDRLQISVWDNGLGIAYDMLKKINYSLANGETNSADGYGIFNVNERIRLYYGEQYGLLYESEEGEWTKAILTLPAVKAGNEICIRF
jgi:two-component system, sensor histidine kinase YesM